MSKQLMKISKLNEKLILNEGNEFIYQLPKDINKLYLKQSIDLTPCNIKIIGKVNKRGDNPGDILIQGTKEDIEKFLDDYFDYAINDDYLYDEDEFDTSLYDKISLKEVYDTEERIKELKEIKKERPLTDEEYEELNYCENEVSSRDAETRYLNGESLEEKVNSSMSENGENPNCRKYFNNIINLLKDYGLDNFTIEWLSHSIIELRDTSNRNIAKRILEKNGYDVESRPMALWIYALEEVINGELEVSEDDYNGSIIKEDIDKEDDLLELEEPIDDFFEDNTGEPEEEVTQEVADNAYLTQINDLITSEYGKIDEVKSIIATFDSEDAINNNSEVIAILNGFIDETTIGIGMLTKATELIDSTTNDLMKQGIEKAEDAIKDIDKDKEEETEE